MSGFFARPGIDLGDGDVRTFAGKQDCGGAADAATGASDEGHLACEPWHRSLLLDRKFENGLRPTVRMDTLTAAVARTRHRAGAMLGFPRLNSRSQRES